MTEHKWLGVDAVDGASAGALRLGVDYESGLACVVLRSKDAHGRPNYFFLCSCEVSEVDTRTRSWIRSLSSLLMPGFGVCPACEKDFNTPDHDPFCSSCVEAGWAEAYRRGHAAGLGADVVALLEAGERLREVLLGEWELDDATDAAIEAYDSARKKAGR